MELARLGELRAYLKTHSKKYVQFGTQNHVIRNYQLIFSPQTKIGHTSAVLLSIVNGVELLGIEEIRAS